VTVAPDRFNRTARALHWLMAALVLTMLLLGAGMMSTVSPTYHRLFGWHRTIGILVLALVAVRLVNRLIRGAPPMPPDLPRWQRIAAGGSHVMLYILMFAIPLVGWATLSAADYPVLIFGDIQLPPIAGHNEQLFALLRPLHRWLAYLLFTVWLVHLGAALFHRLIRRDRVLESMI
jgi:cytochrome b561